MSIPPYCIWAMCLETTAASAELYRPSVGVYFVYGSKPCCFQAFGYQG